MDAGSPKELLNFDDLQSVCGRSRLPAKSSEYLLDHPELEEQDLHWYSIFDPRAPDSVFNRHYWVLPFTNPYTEGQYRAFITTRNWTLMIFALGVGIGFLFVIFAYDTQREWYGIINVTAGVLLILMSPVTYYFVIRPEKHTVQKTVKGSEPSAINSVPQHISKEPSVPTTSEADARLMEPQACIVARAYEKCAVIVLLLISTVPLTMYPLKGHCFRGRTGAADYATWWKTCDLDYAVHPQVIVFFLAPMTICTLRFLCVAPIVLLWLLLGFAGRAIDPVDSSLNAGLGALVFIAVAFSTILASFAVDLASRKRFEQLARLQRTRADLEQRQESVESILAQLLPPEAMSQLHTERILVESSVCCSIAIFTLDDFHRCCWEFSPPRLTVVLTAIHSLFDFRLKTLSTTGVTKIRARGDRYVTSCGLRQVNDSEGKNPLGLDRQAASSSRPQQSALAISQFSQWQLRGFQRLEAAGLFSPSGETVDEEESKPRSIWKPKVAVGTGSCAGGVIGYGSLYYEAVGAAPRLAETILVYAPPFQVTVCHRTAELVRQDFGQTPLFLATINPSPHPAFIIHTRIRGGGGDFATHSRGSPTWRVAAGSDEASHQSSIGKEGGQQLTEEAEADSMEGGESNASAPVRTAKKDESDRAQYLAAVVSRLRQRQGLQEQNVEDRLVTAVGVRVEGIGSAVAQPESESSPKVTSVPITTHLTDTEALATELSDFLVEAPAARFCHLLPFPRESVLNPLYHRWKERCDHIDGTVGTASVFLFYSTVLIALLVNAREQIVGLALFCVAYLLIALRLCAKCFVKRWSAFETVLSLVVVETLGLVSLSLIYYEKKTKTLPTRENLLYPDASPDYYYHIMALCSVMWCRHVDWRVILAQRVIQVAFSFAALFWKRFYFPEYIATAPLETFFIVVAAFHFQKSARIFFATEVLVSSTEDLAKSRYLLQQGILELLVPNFALPRVILSLTQQMDDARKGQEASTKPGRKVFPEMLNGIISSCELSVYLIIRYDEKPSEEDQLSGSSIEANVTAEVEGLFASERAFKPLDDALLEVAHASGPSIQKVRIGGGQAVVAGPYLSEEDQGGTVTQEHQMSALQQLLDLILLLEEGKVKGEQNEARSGRFTYVLSVGHAMTVVVGLSPPQVDVLGAAARQAQALLDAAPPGLIVISEQALRSMSDQAVRLPRFQGDLQVNPLESWAVRGAGLVRVGLLSAPSLHVQ